MKISNETIMGVIIIAGVFIIGASVFASLFGYERNRVSLDPGDCSSYERYNCK